MAEGKKSVLLYCDIIKTVEKMKDVDAGKFFKHYLRYINDLNPKAPTMMIDIAFEPVKQQLKRDLVAWEIKSKKNSDAANKRWGNMPDYAKTYVKMQTHTNAMRDDAKNADTVTDTVTDTDIKKINIEFDVFWNLYDKKVGSKDSCVQKWKKLKDEEREKIIETLPAFISRISDKQFQPHPQTYLNQKRWNDELTSTKPNGNPLARIIT